MSPTYVPDVVRASLDLLIDGESGIWHLANAGAATWFELALHVVEAAELDRSRVEPATSAEIGWIAPRPAYSALTSVRGQVMPTLDDAITRYTERRSAKKQANDEQVKGAA
jgi:dTDP-4-dehydrorhamnose reductase